MFIYISLNFIKINKNSVKAILNESSEFVSMQYSLIPKKGALLGIQTNQESILDETPENVPNDTVIFHFLLLNNNLILKKA